MENRVKFKVVEKDKKLWGQLENGRLGIIYRIYQKFLFPGQVCEGVIIAEIVHKDTGEVIPILSVEKLLA
jgi:hypothetical protein